MNVTPLSAVRIASELGLAGGTITGGTYAVKYSQQVTVVTEERDKAIDAKKPAEDKNVNLTQIYTQVSSYWESIKEKYKGNFSTEMGEAIEKMRKELGVADCDDDANNASCTQE